MPQSLPPVAVEYPDGDGKPMADDDTERDIILSVMVALRLHYAERRDVYVSGGLPIYYREGDPRVSVAPDVFLVFGVEKRRRRSYKLWEEGKAPDLVLEVASPSTWLEDLKEKPGLYAGLGVREYFLFDPWGKYLKPRLRGYRLVEGEHAHVGTVDELDGGDENDGREYAHVGAVHALDDTLRMRSEVLGESLWAWMDEIRITDPESSRFLPFHEEEPATRRVAEARVAELRGLLR